MILQNGIKRTGKLKIMIFQYLIQIIRKLNLVQNSNSNKKIPAQKAGILMPAKGVADLFRDWGNPIFHFTSLTININSKVFAMIFVNFLILYSV